MNEIADRARQAGRRADADDTTDHLARAGLIAFGVVHLVLGWLCVQLALGDREGSTSTSGAVQQLAEQPFGSALVWAVGIGMFLLVVWQAVEAVVGHRDEDGADLVRKRVTSAGKAVLYAVIGVSAIKVALGDGGGGGGGGGSEQQTDSLTGDLMELPGGQVLVGLVALGIFVVAGFLVHRGVTDGFLKKVSGAPGAATTWLGRAGYVAKGLSLGVVGGLFAYAAITHRSKESGGLDQALTTVLEQPFGPVLLGLIGLGFACFGAFCFVWSRWFRE